MELPKTLKEAVDYFIPWFEGMENDFKKTENLFSAYCHSQLSGGIGMQIRNHLGFWSKDTAIYHHMVDVHQLNHADDMSDLIIREIHKKMQ